MISPFEEIARKLSQKGFFVQSELNTKGSKLQNTWTISSKKEKYVFTVDPVNDPDIVLNKLNIVLNHIDLDIWKKDTIIDGYGIIYTIKSQQ